jgi:hypothetical protein
MKHDYGFINGVEQLEAIFGEKLSFHDAEVTRLELRRGREEFGEALLDIDIHLFAVEGLSPDDRSFVYGRHHLASLQFVSIQELELSDFNHQNAIMGLQIRELNPPINGARYQVSIPAAYGLDARFNCFEVLLRGIHPCFPSGRQDA